jgi:pimeloyl-ACP methyl ester carboxylesterase
MTGRGYTFLSANTRGHDFGAALRGLTALTGGSAWESLQESPRDVAGWVDFLFAWGYRRVVLAGHGLGARKAAFYLTERLDPRVVGLVVASPIVLKHPGGAPTEEERSLLSSARGMVGSGRGRDLLPWPVEGCPFGGDARSSRILTSPSRTFALTGHGRRRRSSRR